MKHPHNVQTPEPVMDRLSGLPFLISTRNHRIRTSGRKSRSHGDTVFESVNAKNNLAAHVVAISCDIRGLFQLSCHENSVGVMAAA